MKLRSNKTGDVHVFFNKVTNNFRTADSIINDVKGHSPGTFFTYSRNALGVLAWGNDPFYNPELQVLYLRVVLVKQKRDGYNLSWKENNFTFV